MFRLRSVIFRESNKRKKHKPSTPIQALFGFTVNIKILKY